MNKEDYNGYKAKGGILTREYYELAIESSENGWKSLSKEAASFSQARHMANYAEIELTEVEKLMYVFLRIRPQGLNDQVLMAEVLLITSNEELGKFIDRWPNIFQV